MTRSRQSRLASALVSPLPIPISRKWWAVGLGSLSALILWTLWHAMAGDGGALWSVPHANYSPLGYTTLGGLIPALAASGRNPIYQPNNRPQAHADNSPSAPRPKPEQPKPNKEDEIPFWFPKPGDLWTERALKDVEQWVMAGDGDMGKLMRGLGSTFVIVPFGIGVYAEDALRNNWIIGGMGIGR